jgi:cell division septum initiation protein DivIVA
MNIDRKAITRTDFPETRRGYDKGVVDAHLAAVAEEFEALRAQADAPPPAPPDAPKSAQIAPVTEAPPASPRMSLADHTSRQIHGIVEAAERSAEQIRDDAAKQSKHHVEKVEQASERLKTRIQDAEQQVGSAVEKLRAGIDRLHDELVGLKTDASALRVPDPSTVLAPDDGPARGARSSLSSASAPASNSSVGSSPAAAKPAASASGAGATDAKPADSGGGAGGAGPQPVARAGAAPAAVADAPKPAASAVSPPTPGPLPAPAISRPQSPARPAPSVTAQPPATAQPGASASTLVSPPAQTAAPGASTAVEAAPEVAPSSRESEAARIVAFDLALNGTSREEASRILAQTYHLADREALLDEVYRAAGAS